ncbi:MAG: cyclic nucleotide-binding domain-containing protein [Acidimicrobiales bacterium]
MRWTGYQRRLAAQPLFAACSRSELRAIARWGDAVEVDAGRVLFREDTIGYYFVVVVSGRLGLTRRGRAITTLGPGAHAGDVAILGFGPQPATLTTLSNCELFVMSRVALLSLALNAAGVRQGLFPGLSRSEVQDAIREMRRVGLAGWPGRDPTDATRAAIAVTRPAALACSPPQARPPHARSSHRHSQPPADLTTSPRRVATRRSRGPLFVAAVMSAILVTVSLTAHPPVVVVTPGQPIDVAGDLSITGAPTWPVHGHYIVTSVRFDQPTYAGWLRARADGDPTVPLASDQSTARHAASQAFSDAQAAAVDAAAVVARISPATIRVRFRQHNLSGPSASLIYAITIADLLDPFDLAAGRTIAATGVLDYTGRVRGVGFVKQKAAVARASGATIFLVPVGEDPGDVGMRVVQVATLSDAVAALRAR